jgi:hypothetical protein
MKTETKPNTHESENGFSEAPASWNTRYVHPSGFECQITLRGDTGTELLEKVQIAIEYLLENDCQPYSYNRYGGAVKVKQQAEKTNQGNSSNNNDDQSWCPIHQCEMRRWEKDGRTWFSHKTDSGWCQGK